MVCFVRSEVSVYVTIYFLFKGVRLVGSNNKLSANTWLELSGNIILLSAAKDTLLFIIMYSLRSLPASPTITRKPY